MMAAYSEFDGNERDLFMDCLLENSHAAKAMGVSERQKVAMVLHELLQGTYLLIPGEHTQSACLPCANVRPACVKNSGPQTLETIDSGVGHTGTESVGGKSSAAHEGRQGNRECTPDQGETLVCIEEAMITVQQASGSIMDAAEAVLEKQEEILALLEDPDDLIALFAMQEDLMTTIITACSFDDLTGQRLKAIKQYVLSMPASGTPVIPEGAAVLGGASGTPGMTGKGGTVAGKGNKASGKSDKGAGKGGKVSGKGANKNAKASANPLVSDAFYASGKVSASEKIPNAGLSGEKEPSQPQKAKDAEVRNSALKGPTLDASQSDVDDLLATLGS